MEKIEYNMSDKPSLNGVRELKLGASFTNSKASQYHTIKYDFKPASVDVKKMATVDVEANHQVTVTLPHLDGAGTPQTVFKGNQRPYQKECVLIIDKNTGEVTLEKLSSNIQVKKTRQESLNKPRPLTPIGELNVTARQSSRTKVASGGRRTQNGTSSTNNGKQTMPSSLVSSPPRHKTSPPQAAPWCGGASTMASLPLIGLDDAPAAAVAHQRPPPPQQHHPPPQQHHPPPQPPPQHHLPPQHHPPHHQQMAPQPPPMQKEEDSHSTSSSSSSESGSDSDSDTPNEPQLPPAPRQPTNGGAPLELLNHDLCLSESGSDLD